jgi:hypothetical protein
MSIHVKIALNKVLCENCISVGKDTDWQQGVEIKIGERFHNICWKCASHLTDELDILLFDNKKGIYNDQQENS